MRILVITPWYPTIAAPVAGVFVQRDAALVAAEHDVELVHLVEPALLSAADIDADADAPFPVHRVPLPRNDPRGLARAWRALRPMIQKADVIHTHAFPALLVFAGRRVRRPWVHSEHWSGVANPQAFNVRGRLFFRVTAPLLRRPDVVTAVSSFLLDRVREHRSGRTMIVPSVVPPVEPRSAGHVPGELRLVTVANLVEGKDPALAVETVRELRRRGITTTLRWIGDGPLRDEIQRTLTPDSGVTLVGALDRSGVSAELDAAEIFLLPTRGETLCLSAIEAISHGRPVVMGAVGGQRDYITDGNGVLVEPRTPAAYADAVVEVAESMERFTAESVAATVHGRFTPERVLELYEAAYHEAEQNRKAKS